MSSTTDTTDWKVYMSDLYGTLECIRVVKIDDNTINLTAFKPNTKCTNYLDVSVCNRMTHKEVYEW